MNLTKVWAEAVESRADPRAAQVIMDELTG